ncbi:hypothetical protein BTUL_0192g00020 [Botrytis tulipae]|uniref:AB hydrolase-1 domain-containing protein n=1 Tax=Botrytis tulipae TaxID=87230 RepID=A0A4Z1EEG2_9HELO|nr:hypothetical protein BTUL_0192g00020 [Botrytis tulipae]
MGLGSNKSTWQRQTLYFGHERGDKYSSLVFDNRGMGGSDTPILRYSTSEMAKDCVELLDHLGWTKDRQLNITGVSMGGMIAQELALMIPNRIATLNLLSTAPYIENTTSFFENLRTRVMMFVPKPLDRSVLDASLSLFPASWLSLPDTSQLLLSLPSYTPYPPCYFFSLPRLYFLCSRDLTPKLAHLPSESTPLVEPPPGHPFPYAHFSTNYERFAAAELTKRLNPKAFKTYGFLLQAIAAGWHHKSPAQLKELGDKVGRDRIAVMHGTLDRLISFPHGEKLMAFLQPGKAEIREGDGHAIPIQEEDWFHERMVAYFEEFN